MNNKEKKHWGLVIWCIILSIVTIFLFVVFLANEFSLKAKDFADGWGSLLGGVFGAAATIFVVGLTIKSNKKIMLQQLQLQNKPILNTVLSVGKEPLLASDTITRQFQFYQEYAANNGWVATQNKENLDEAIGRNYSILSLVNNGHGPAFKVSIFLTKLTAIDGLVNLKDFMKNDVSNVYEKCKTENYNRDENGTKLNDDWLLYTDFSLTKSQKMNFTFNYLTRTNEFSLLNIIYEDTFGIEYTQKVILMYCDDRPSLYPISKQY